MSFRRQLYERERISAPYTMYKDFCLVIIAACSEAGLLHSPFRFYGVETSRSGTVPFSENDLEAHRKS